MRGLILRVLGRFRYEYVRLVKLKGRNPIEVVVEQTSEKKKK